MSAPPCCHCDGWGCSRCGSPPPAPVGEQGDRDLAELDARVAAAVRAERTEIAALVRDLGDAEGFWREGTSALGTSSAILARGGA